MQGTSLEKSNGNLKLYKGKNSIKTQKVKSNLEFLLLMLPALLFYVIWQYIPIGGLVMAFQEYNVGKGVFRGDWVGLSNFDYFFKSQDALLITRNTIAYGVAFIATGLFSACVVALMMFELRSKIFIKAYQTILIIPRFLSWVVVGFVTYAFLSPSHGIMNELLQYMGIKEISWYMELKYWPFILTFANIWKYIGMNSIMYYAFLIGIDSELFEAAMIDGANRWQQIRYISIPSLVPLMVILGILQISTLFRGDFGLFYQIPRDVGPLYPVTDIIDTYVYRGLRSGNYAISSAVGLFQSVAAFIMIVGSNWIVRRIDPEKSLF